VFPVRYGLNSYLLFRRYSVFKAVTNDCIECTADCDGDKLQTRRLVREGAPHLQNRECLAVTHDYTSQITITHRPMFSVTAFNSGLSSSSLLTSSEAWDHLTQASLLWLTVEWLCLSRWPPYILSTRTGQKTPLPTVPPSLLADSLPSDCFGIVACLYGRCLVMVFSLAPLFRLSEAMSQYTLVNPSL
jgi:hypothetical protein